MEKVTAKLDGEFVDVEWFQGEDKHNLLIKPEDILANHTSVGYYEDKLVLNGGQIEVIKDLFAAIEKEEYSNRAGLLNLFIPYINLKSYIYGVDKEE